jgi:protein arginine kinase activator
MPERHEDKPGKHKPDRPLECSECKKPITVIYTEIVSGQITHTSMCSDCPELQRRLQGAPLHLQTDSHDAGLACGNCNTTLEAIRVGASLGCSSCYEVFTDILVSEMQAANKLSSRINSIKKAIPLHIGRTPGKIQEINPSLRLLALNEALNETLKREDYEQAAWLRDQIKELTESQEKDKDERKK